MHTTITTLSEQDITLVRDALTADEDRHDALLHGRIAHFRMGATDTRQFIQTVLDRHRAQHDDHCDTTTALDTLRRTLDDLVVTQVRTGPVTFDPLDTASITTALDRMDDQMLHTLHHTLQNTFRERARVHILTLIRAELADQFPGTTAIGALFATTGDYDNDYQVSDYADVLLDDGTVLDGIGFEFGPFMAEAFEGYAIAEDLVVEIDLRHDTFTEGTTVRDGVDDHILHMTDIYARFGVPELRDTPRRYLLDNPILPGIRAVLASHDTPSEPIGVVFYTRELDHWAHGLDEHPVVLFADGTVTDTLSFATVIDDLAALCTDHRLGADFSIAIDLRTNTHTTADDILRMADNVHARFHLPAPAARTR